MLSISAPELLESLNLQRRLGDFHMMATTLQNLAKVAYEQGDNSAAREFMLEGLELREKIGDDDFFNLLKTWTRTHRHGNGTTKQFTALAEWISGEDLDAFFQTWIYSAGKPTL